MSHALPGLPLATNQTSYPVLIYSHGYGGHRRQNTDKAEELASHGYVVVACGSQGCFRIGISKRPGRISEQQTAAATQLQCFQPVLDNRIKDFLFVLDELSRLNTNDALLAGRLDLERLGAFGYLLGRRHGGRVLPDRRAL